MPDISCVGGFTDANALIAGINSKQDKPLTEEVTKTVGVGQDFETFQEALDWYNTLIFAKGGSVTINLPNGTHYIGYDPLKSAEYSYFWALVAIRNGVLNIAGSSQVGTIITFENVVDISDNWYDMFAVSDAATLTFRNVTIDPFAGGLVQPDPGYRPWVYVFSGAHFSCTTSVLNTLTLATWQNATARLASTDVVDTILSTYLEGVIYLNNCSIKDFTTAENYMEADNGGRISMLTTTFTNMGTGTLPFSLNTFQRDGSYISDGTAPIYSDGLAALLGTLDEVIEVATYADLPATGTIDKLYVVAADETQGGGTTSYRWSGTVYTLVGGGAPAIIYTPVNESGLIAYTPDFSTHKFFTYGLTQDADINFPTNMTEGDEGTILIVQDATGGWVATFNSGYYFPAGAPALNTDPNAVNVFKYTRLTATIVMMEFVADIVQP